MPATAPKQVSDRWPTLLGSGDAFVVNLPSGFSLKELLKQAKEIRLASAFAHYAGWQHMKDAIENGGASVYLLTGSEFFQTEPRLLKAWLALMHVKDRHIETRFAADDPFFHPKVLIVTGGAQRDFAVVGSGNLSNGGLHTNAECSIYTEDAATIGELIKWFGAQFNAGTLLDSDVIDEYERSYKKSQKRRDKLQSEQRTAAKRMTEIGRAGIKRWDDAVSAAVHYFVGPKFKSSYDARRNAAPRILKALDSPNFNFRHSGFDAFYRIGELGQLDYRWKDKVFGKANRLKKGLRLLIANPESALGDVLGKEGQHYVPGVRLNFVSKVLAASDPERWHVFNSKVAKALRSFQYQPARGSGTVGRYLAYCDLMKKFIEACKAEGCKTVDAFALDAFFFHWARRLENQKRR